MSFTIAPKLPAFGLLEKLLSSCERKRNGKLCFWAWGTGKLRLIVGRIDWWPCQKQKRRWLRHATDERTPREVRGGSWWRKNRENWFIIHFLLRQSLHPSPRVFSRLKVLEVCFTIFQFCWWDVKTKGKVRGDGGVFTGWRVKWFNIQNAVCERESLINLGNGRQVQGEQGIEKSDPTLAIHKFSFISFTYNF